MDAPTISKIYRSFLRGDLSITFSIDNTIIRMAHPANPHCNFPTPHI